MSPRYSAVAVCKRRRRRTGLRRMAVGKESTSVGPFFLRNISFIRAISVSLTKQTVRSTSSSPSSFFTRRRNNSSGRRAARTACCWFRIILAGFLFLVLSRTLSPSFPPCHSRYFHHAAVEPHHTLHRRG